MTKPIFSPFSPLTTINVQPYERYLPAAFDDSLSMLEKINKVREYANQIGLTTNQLIEQWNELSAWVLGDGLSDEIANKMQEWLDDGTIGRIINSDMYVGYNINTTQPSYFTSLNFPNSNPAFGPIMQGFYITKDARNIYSNYINFNEDTGQDSFYLVRFDSTGKELDRMLLKDVGHGTTLGFEEQDTNVYFWLDLANGTNGTRLGRFLYEAGQTLTIDNIAVYSSFGGLTQGHPIVDGAYLYMARDNGNSTWTVEKRLLADVKTGVDNLITSINIPSTLNWLQGYAVDEDKLYWLTGDAYEVGNYAQLLTEFSWTTKQQTRQIDLSFAPVEDQRKEPEGLFVYTDPKTGAKSLFVGIASDDYVEKNNKLYAFHSVLNFRKFTGMKLEDIPRNIESYQPQQITGFDGRQLFTINSGESVFNKVKNFQGLATGYANSGTTDGADTTNSGRLLINFSSYGTGYIQWIDWQNRMWFCSVLNGLPVKYDSRHTWQRLATFDIMEKPWTTLPLLTGASVNWSYPPEVRRIFNRIELRGCVGGVGTVKIATLDASYRPTHQIRKPVCGDGSATAIGRMTIATNGDITIDFNTLTAVWIDTFFDAGITVD